MNVRNILFSAACSIVALSFILYAIAFSATGTMPQESYLEGRVLATVKDIGFKPIVKGETQREMEDFVADHVPFREEALIAHVNLQRLSISQMAALHGFSSSPTYFGSEIEVVDNGGAVLARYENPETDVLETLRDDLNASASAHPDVRFFVDMLVLPTNSTNNPTFEMIGGTKTDTAAWVQENFLDKLDSRIEGFVDPYEHVETYGENWFKSDGHWTLKRALENYGQLAQIAGLTPATWGDDHITMRKDAWRGAWSRTGLYFSLYDSLSDMDTDFSMLEFSKYPGDPKNRKLEPGLREEVIDGTATQEDIGDTDAYRMYYGRSNCIIDNQDGGNGRTCLMVTDSFGYNLKRYIAANYAKTVVVLPGNNPLDETFDDLIGTYGVDDVIFLLHSQKPLAYYNQSPQFFSR